jgi:hypothetical protein
MLKLLSNNDKNKIEDFNPQRSLLDKLCNFQLKDIILPEDSKKKLYHILQENNKPNLSFDQVKEKATTQIEGYKTNIETSLFNFSFLSECNNLPDEENQNLKCYEVGIFKYVTVLWDLLTSTKTKDDKDQIKSCFKHLINDQILQTIIKFTTEQLLGIIKKVLGFMFLRVVKSLYYSIRLLVRFLKASVVKDVAERSERLGEAAGFAVKMLMSSACGKKKRRMKFRKFK